MLLVLGRIKEKRIRLIKISGGLEERKKGKRVKPETKKNISKTVLKSIENGEYATNTGVGQNIFKTDWMDSKNLLFDINGDRLSDYLAPVSEDPSLAKCLACRTSFSISQQGVGQVYVHARGGQHKAS